MKHGSLKRREDKKLFDEGRKKRKRENKKK